MTRDTPTHDSSDGSIRPGMFFTLGSSLPAFLAYGWASTLIQEGGRKPSHHFGLLFGLFAGFAVALYLVDFLLWRMRLSTAVRSGLWAAAAFGPWAAFLFWSEFALPTWSLVTGLVCTILFFLAFHSLENWLQARNRARK